MLRTLIGSQPVHEGWFGGTAVSTVTHGALIALAVVSTTHNGTSVQERRAYAPVEHITYVDPTRFMTPPPATRAATAARAKPAKPAQPDLWATNASVELALSSVRVPEAAAPDLTSVTDAWIGAADSLSTLGSDIASKLLASAVVHPPENGIYTEDMVERGVKPLRGNPTPRYPSMLQDMGIEGDFVVKFVVDTTGAVVADKIEFPSSMHRLFADAVRRALRASRYFPATFGGQVVPQLVVQEFRFTMGRRR